MLWWQIQCILSAQGGLVLAGVQSEPFSMASPRRAVAAYAFTHSVVIAVCSMYAEALPKAQGTAQ